MNQDGGSYFYAFFGATLTAVVFCFFGALFYSVFSWASVTTQSKELSEGVIRYVAGATGAVAGDGKIRLDDVETEVSWKTDGAVKIAMTFKEDDGDFCAASIASIIEAERTRLWGWVVIDNITAGGVDIPLSDWDIKSSIMAGSVRNECEDAISAQRPIEIAFIKLKRQRQSHLTDNISANKIVNSGHICEVLSSHRRCTSARTDN